jgi:hypothetical protein
MNANDSVVFKEMQRDPSSNKTRFMVEVSDSAQLNADMTINVLQLVQDNLVKHFTERFTEELHGGIVAGVDMKAISNLVMLEVAKATRDKML